MTRNSLTARCAPVAIAAILALGPTTVVAQDAATQLGPVPAPVLPAPIMQAPVAPAPTPTANPSPRFISEPQVQPVPEPDPIAPSSVETAADAVPQTAAPLRESAPVPRATARPSATPAQPAATSLPASESAQPVTNTIADPAPAVEFPEIDPTVDPVQPSVDGADTAGDVGESGVIGLVAAALAGLIPIGIAVAALVWWRRRSRPVAAAPVRTQAVASPPISAGAKKAVEPDARAVPQRATVSAPMVVAPEPTWVPQQPSAPVTYGGSNVTVAERPVATPTRNDDRYAEPVVPEDDVRSSYVPDASPATLSSSAPRDAEHRRQLLESMVDAQPDARNPFTSRKARMRRARLILASMENV